MQSQESTQPSPWEENLSNVATPESKNEWGILVSINTNFPNYRLQEKEITIGRKKSATIHYNQGTISGTHCRIWFEKDVAYVQDLSTNGTFIDGIKLGKFNQRVVSSGSRITLIPKSANRDEVGYVIHLHGTQRPQYAIDNQYAVGAMLGKGAFAIVRTCVHRISGQKFACKIIEKRKFAALQNSKRGPEALMDEVRILQRLNHKHIIKIHDIIDTKDHLYLILELVTGGELFDKIAERVQPESWSREIFAQLVDAIAYLHSQGIAHRDLKPENILLKDKNSTIIKVTDFGLSRIVGKNSFMTTLCGTPQYLAPEVISETKTNRQGYSKEVDLWSLGVILYVLVAGALPYDDINTNVPIYDQIKTGVIPFPDRIFRRVSRSVIDLIKRLLKIDPAERIPLDAIRQHPWMLGKRDMPAKSMKRKKPADSILSVQMEPASLPSEDSLGASRAKRHHGRAANQDNGTWTTDAAAKATDSGGGMSVDKMSLDPSLNLYEDPPGPSAAAAGADMGGDVHMARLQSAP